MPGSYSIPDRLIPEQNTRSPHLFIPPIMLSDTDTDLYQNESFRDSISTVDKEGKRIWIYPKKPSGRFFNARKWVSYGLLIILFAGPFIKIGGQPLLMLNILERKFVIFGSLFTPQDFFTFVLVTILAFVFIVLFTVVFGRIWCGWTCPQTIFMEMVFRRIEYWLEGDANQQRKLNQAPWSQEKIMKKTAKHILFLMISFLISNMFLGYIVGGDRLLELTTAPPTANWGTFFVLSLFTGVFYWVFAFFREQVCTNVCPYGRLQGVLLDKDSVVISYDHVRGEPRGKLQKAKAAAPQPETKKGDCVDCGLCVQVCPTAIDIRNGTQLECINCTACIDACDTVMDKVGKPRGLIRYASHNNIVENKPLRFTPRLIGYSFVLVALLAAVTYSFTGRSVVETTILRAPGTIFQTTEEGLIRNLYTFQVINKSSEQVPLEIRLKEPQGGRLTIAGGELLLKAEGHLDGAMVVELPKESTGGRKTTLTFEVYSGDQLIDVVKTNFMGPAK